MKNKIRKQHRVDIITTFFFPVAAGIETNIEKTYGPMTNRGWNCAVHTTKDTHIDKNVLASKERISGIEVIRYKSNPLSYFPNIDYKNTDIVALHNFNIFPHFFVMVRTLILKIFSSQSYKLILTPHGGFNPEWKIFSLKSRIVKYIYHRTIGVLLINLSCDGVRAVSEWEMEEMKKWGIHESKIRVISNGVEDEAFLPLTNVASDIRKIRESLGEYIVQVGRIYPIKNYETAIKALSLINKNIKYLIIGPISDRKYYESLKKLIKSLNMENRVIFGGVVRGQDKLYLIKNAKLMIHLALWESFCNVVHEAMSQGLPCIVSKSTALPYLIKEGVNGFLVDIMDYKNASERISYILDPKNKVTVDSIRKNNLKFAKSHSWSKVSIKMEQFYIDLISSKNIL